MPWLKKTSDARSSAEPSKSASSGTYRFHIVSTSTKNTFRPSCVWRRTYESRYRHSFHRWRPHPGTGSPGSGFSLGETTWSSTRYPRDASTSNRRSSIAAMTCSVYPRALRRSYHAVAMPR